MNRRATSLLPALTLTTLTAACSSGAGSGGSPLESVSKVDQAIVNGSPSSSSDDFVVRINIGNGGLCTGTLIAPNLVLTARHCVTNIDESTECGTFTTNLSPSTISIALGANAGTSSVARATKLFVETGAGSNSGCSHDIALFQLDKDVAGAKIAKVRLSKLAIGEGARTVGYGESGNGNLTPGRYAKSGLEVDAVGPSNYTFKTKQNKSIAVDVPSGEIVTGESTCFGDSGGPLFDASDNVIGVTSRGVDDSCVDRPSIYSDTASHAALIKSAAEAAGHPLVEATPPPTPADPTDSKPATDEDDDDTGASSGTNKKASKGDDDEEDDDTTSSAKRPALVSAGCSAAPAPEGAREGGAPVAVVALGAGLALASARRRKRRE